MELKEGLRRRRSCRKYQDRPVDREIIRQIVELARFAPSWQNKQCVRYTVVDDGEVKNEIARECVLGLAFNTKTITRAAAIAVVSCEKGLSGYGADGTFETPRGGSWMLFDAGAAVQTFCLAAREWEVGTCILGTVDGEAIHRKLALPASEEVVCVVALGYPEQWKAAPQRKAVEELLRFR